MKFRAVIMTLVLASCASPTLVVPRLASELVGRSAGDPQRCVPIEQGSGLRIAQGDNHTLLYGSGRTVWANHLGPGCGFRASDVLIVEPRGSSYCRGELVRSMDAVSNIPGPGCILGDFVPYSR